MSAIQLNFTLRTSANCKTVHLLGSWDNYAGQLPLSKDSAKAGGWKGTFRFQGSTLKQGQRYWYYYIIDGYHVSHDPAREFTTEPTTGRKLNILDIPGGKAPAAKPQTVAPARDSAKAHNRRMSRDIPKGRALSPSQIQSPKPYKPGQVQHVVAENYSQATMEQLASRFSRTTVEDESEEPDSDDSSSDDESDVPSLTSRSSRSSNSSSPSSVSSTSSCCTCERYGITRSGNRVKLDCGGSRCGYSDDSTSCSSESEEETYKLRTTRRQGVVVR